VIVYYRSHQTAIELRHEPRPIVTNVHIDDATLAGRAYAEVYRVTGKRDVYDVILRAVAASGGEVLYASPSNRAPIYVGVRLPSDEHMGLLIYAFRMKRKVTKGRPEDEVRGQLRYGSEGSWTRQHRLGRDIAGVDTTLILGVDAESEVLVALDPQLYDLLPMGNSFYMKDRQVEETKRKGWHVWEAETRDGTKRAARSPSFLETLISCTPENLLRLARLERRARALRLEPALRYSAAIEAVNAQDAWSGHRPHALEEQFALRSHEIIDIIAKRNRLSVAVRGGVAEYHLEAQLRKHPDVELVEPLDTDAMHDFNVRFRDGTRLRIECKNASPSRFANGDFKVEVQKTRGSQNDPASRFYRADAFDVVAACMYSPTGDWVFRFARTQDLPRHGTFPDRLAAIQRVNDSWTSGLESLTAERLAAQQRNGA
jgi:Arc/MetJ family transcription regulator